MILFWRVTDKYGAFSQWYPSEFFVVGHTYNCCEQYMMSEKAKLMNDTETFNLIMSETDPKKIKALGRKVKNFDSHLWDCYKKEVILTANLAKFTQNSELKKLLLGTGEEVIAEASPVDNVYGIGMAECKEAEDVTNWKGSNLLGYCLMTVRDMLRHGRDSYSEPGEYSKDYLPKIASEVEKEKSENGRS